MTDPLLILITHKIRNEVGIITTSSGKHEFFLTEPQAQKIAVDIITMILRHPVEEVPA